MEEFDNANLSVSKKYVSFKHPESSVAKQKKFLHDLKVLLSLVK
jgi:hypothetical protein